MLESKRKALIFLLLAIILAATSGYLILQKVQSLNEDLGTFVTVYKANGDIASRKIITASDVTTEQIPQRYLRDDYITSESQLTNMVSLVPLTEGDIITDTMLKEASAITSENTRLITLIQSERIFFDEALAPGDRVDIVVSHEFNNEPVTEVFMENVNVIQTSKDDETNNFLAARVEIPFDRVTELIHLQNYADSLRIVRASVGKNIQDSLPQQQTEGEESSEGNETSEQTNNEQNNNESNQEETDQNDSSEE